MHGIYKITNLLNNKVYIGQTTQGNKRWLKHKFYAKDPDRTGQYIHYAMAKYGVDNFVFEFIATSFTQIDADKAEAQIIQQYNSRDKQFGYNLKPGGGTTGHSEETKQKLREATLKQIETKGHPAQGRKLTDEQKAKLIAMLNARDNEKVYSPEVRKRMSESHIGKPQPKELVEKRASTIRANKGEMICAIPGCGIIEDRRHAPVINGVRYCGKHGWHAKKNYNIIND